MRAVGRLGARPGNAYRDSGKPRLIGDVILERERSFVLRAILATSAIAGLVLTCAWPAAVERVSHLEVSSVAVQLGDLCALGNGAIECDLEHVEQCVEVHEGRHVVDEVCDGVRARRRWLEGAESVFTGLHGFCGVRGRTIECMDRDLHVELPDSPRQVVGSAQMICSRGATDRVRCFDHRGEPMSVDMQASRIASGPHHVCALTAEGVWCWDAHRPPFLSTHRRGGRDLAVADTHVCVRQDEAFCVSFYSRERIPWPMRGALAGTPLASRGGEVCGIGLAGYTLECSQSGTVPYLDLRSTSAQQLALAGERACVRDHTGQLRCQSLESHGAWLYGH